MSKLKFLAIFNLFLAFVCMTGCQRSHNDVWDDTRSAGRHMGRGFRTLGGKHGDSRQVRSRDEFYSQDPNENNAYSQEDFIPLTDKPGSEELDMMDSVAPPPRENPGDPGSSIPGIEAFRDPSTIPGLSGVFRNIHFEYNSYLVKGQNNLQVVSDVADYMRRNPRMYIFVEGHCDERGPEAYNLALGSRRSNAVRNLLISEGVSPDNIFTISYGRERPIVFEHHEDAWSQNRRAEFKVYQR